MEQHEFDWRSPLAAFAPLAGRDGAMLFHGGDAAVDARWSFIVAAPTRVVSSAGGLTSIDGAPVAATPFEALSELHSSRRCAGAPECGSPLASGLVGFCGYECGGFSEPSAKGPGSPHRLPDFWFAAYDAVAAFDRFSQRAFLLGRTSDTADRLGSMLGGADLPPPAAAGFDPPASNFSRDAYCGAVSEVIERIRNGDLFQANISQRLQMRSHGPIDAYGLFCAAAPQSSSAFGAVFALGGADVISLSPERFFAVRPDPSGRLAITAEPIKGTRPRGETQEEDARLRADLIADPKDRAENIMIADLIRNDLSKICDDCSIREEAICEAIAYATVHHLVSRISGRLRRGVNAADALGALFPCGSITGAPKVEAMKAIAAVEKTGRGPYCGAIGYIDDGGGADFSVAIRIAVAEDGRLSIPVGGGVTLRSDPEAEYEETLAKARQFLLLAGLEEQAAR